MKDSKPQASKAAKGGLTSEIQARIGHQLRAMYDDVVRQGVPDRFADLLRQMDAPRASQALADGDSLSADSSSSSQPARKDERRD